MSNKKLYSAADVHSLLCGIFNTATGHDDDCAGIDGDPIIDCTCNFAECDGVDLVESLAESIGYWREKKEKVLA